MCNPYYNSVGCRNTPAVNKKCQTPIRFDDCQRYVHLLHHWYDKPELPKKCACCEQIRCKKNNLLHKLCPVPGLRGETMKQVLFTQALPLCASPAQKCATVVPKTEICEDIILHKSVPKDESNTARRLLVELNGGTARNGKRAAATQKRQMNNFVKGLKGWYAKEMKSTAHLRNPLDTSAAYMETIPRKRTEKRMQKRNSLRQSYHWTTDFNFELDNELSDSILTITSGPRVSIITTNTDIKEVNDTIAMEDITNLLKQIQAKPERPILFHQPFNRDIVWSWRNYDPLDDVPESLAKQQQWQPRKLAYTPWTMNIVNELVDGKPVTDKQFKTNSELQNVVNELAREIKRGKVRRIKRKTR